jgi:hypothetical protein
VEAGTHARVSNNKKFERCYHIVRHHEHTCRETPSVPCLALPALSDEVRAVRQTENSRLKSTEFCVVLLDYLTEASVPHQGCKVGQPGGASRKAKKDGCPGPGTEEQPCLHCTINTACDVSSSDARVSRVCTSYWSQSFLCQVVDSHQRFTLLCPRLSPLTRPPHPMFLARRGLHVVVRRRLMKEHKEITKGGIKGVVAGPIDEDNFLEWEAVRLPRTL